MPISRVTQRSSRRIDLLTLVVVFSTIAVAATLAAAQWGNSSVWTIAVINLGLALAALVVGVGTDGATNPSAAGAGILTTFAALALPAWLWLGTFVLFSDDIVYTCGKISYESGYRPTEALTFVRSYIPPGLFCLPEGYGGPVILGTELSRVVSASVGLLLIVGFLAGAMMLARRSRMLRSKPARGIS